ncbi:MAG TPA: hypothetical protein DEB47_18260 [Citreicella sp.]|nr:hypothetical protein [Citreicella sp.]
MIDQMTFDRSEEITEALHDQEGLAIAMANIIAGLDLPADREHVLLALIRAQDQCRDRAIVAASRIVQSGKEKRGR